MGQKKQGRGIYCAACALLWQLRCDFFFPFVSVKWGGGGEKRIKVNKERRAIRVKRRRKTGDAKSSGVRGADQLLCEYGRAAALGEGKRTNQRSSLIRGETLPPVAPLLAFQMKAADERVCCSGRPKRCVSQLGLSQWNRKEEDDLAAARDCSSCRVQTDRCCQDLNFNIIYLIIATIYLLSPCKLLNVSWKCLLFPKFSHLLLKQATIAEFQLSSFSFSIKMLF